MTLSTYHKLLVVGAVVIFYTNVPEFLHHLDPSHPLLLPKNWILAFCVATIPLSFGPHGFLKILRSPVTLWCFGYLWISVIWFFVSSQDEGTWREVRLRLLAVIELLSFAMILGHPTALQLARRLLVAAVLAGVAVNLYELFFPATFSEVVGRSAGLYRNPNLSGEALLLGMILSATVLRPRYRTLFVLVTGLGILATVSRANILAWALAVAGFVMLGQVRGKDLTVSLFWMCLTGFVLLLPRLDQLLTTWDRAGLFNRDVLQRFEWFTDPFGVSDYSSWSRAQVAKEAWEKFAQAPLVGHGTGASFQAYVEPHNQYLAFMLDHGIIGALILPLLLLAVTWGARGDLRWVGLIFCGAVLLISFGTHTILTNVHSLFLFSCMAALATMQPALRPAPSWSPGLVPPIGFRGLLGPSASGPNR